MKERLTSSQEKYINDWQATLGDSHLVTPIEIARLIYKDDFKKTNRPRLCRHLTNMAIQGVKELDYIVANVPDSYKKRIISSQEWIAFSKRMNRDSQRLKDMRKTDVAVKQVYSSLEQIIKHVPEELLPLLMPDIESLLKRLEGVLNYKNRMEGKERLKIKVPSTLLNSHEPSVTLDT